MTTQPLRRSLSHSQAEMWASCPRKWALAKLDKVPQAPSEALILGSAVHAAIEQDGIRAARREPRLPASALDLVFRDALRAEMLGTDPRGMLAPHQRTAMLCRGQAMLAAYVREVQPRYWPVATEAAFEHDIPDSEWRFTGRIDARTVNARGDGVIADFKTASKPWPVGDEHHKQQAAAYLWAACEAGWEPAVKRVVFVVIDAGGGVSQRPTERTPAQIDAYVAGVRQTAQAIEQAHATGDFPATPDAVSFGKRSQCVWCGCWGACSEGREWMRSHGETPVSRGIGRDGNAVAWEGAR